MNINHISVSRKKTYDTCPQQYKFHYHLKVKSPVPEPFYFVYGTIVHKIAELYVKNKGKTAIGEIAKDVVRGKIPIEDDTLCPPLPDDYQKKFQKHLRAIQKLTERIGPEGIVEHPFEYDLNPPYKQMVVGFIDRLILKDQSGNLVDGKEKKATKAFIIDYKTTKKGPWRVNKSNVTEDLQLRTYARVVQREFGIHAANIQAALFYLEGEEIVAAKFSEQDLVDVEVELKDAYNQIQRADPEKVWGNVGWHCKNCVYATICPFYTTQNSQQTDWDGSMDGNGWN